MKIVAEVLERRIRELVNVATMRLGLTPGIGTTDALFVVVRMQEEYKDKEKKLYIYLVDIGKAFNRVRRKVMKWAMRKNELPAVIARNMMSFYRGAKTKVRVGYELFEEFLAHVGVHQGSMLSPLLFAIAVAASPRMEEKN